MLLGVRASEFSLSEECKLRNGMCAMPIPLIGQQQHKSQNDNINPSPRVAAPHIFRRIELQLHMGKKVSSQTGFHAKMPKELYGSMFLTN